MLLIFSAAVRAVQWQTSRMKHPVPASPKLGDIAPATPSRRRAWLDTAAMAVSSSFLDIFILLPVSKMPPVANYKNLIHPESLPLRRSERPHGLLAERVDSLVSQEHAKLPMPLCGVSCRLDRFDD
jgi:hypothetical protein